MARVTKPFPGVPDGQVLPVQFSIGDIVTGDLAAAAVEAGLAAEEPANAKKPAANKAVAGAPENKA